MTIKLTQVLEELREDHRNLSVLLDLLEAECEGVAGDEEPDFELLRDIMQYMTVYPDAVHHPREDLVYDAMRQYSTDLADGLERVEPDHHEIAELGKTLRNDIEAVISGASVTRQRLIADLRNYVTRLRNHMEWEEEDLFLRADELAAKNENITIDVALFNDGDPLFGEVAHESFSNLLMHLQNFE